MRYETNFVNPKTGKEYWISRHKFTIRGDVKCYFDQNGRPLMDEDGTLLQPIERKVDKVEVPFIGKFKAMSDAEKKATLRKREIDHNKKNGQSDNWHQKNINMN